jgi:hypothetical protein
LKTHIDIDHAECIQTSGACVSQPPTEKPRPRHRRRMKASLTNRILDYPYGRLFGWKGRLVIASVVLIGLAVKFVVGINTVTLDPMSCKLAWSDGVYKIFHKERILANTRRDLNALMREKQTLIYQVNSGRNPYASSTDGNVVNARKINKDKFFWKSFLENLKKERLAIGNCLRQLPNYKFD